MNKIIKIFFMVLFFIIPVSATTTTNYQLLDTDSKNEIKYDNQIQSEFTIIDASDKITSLNIEIEDSGYTTNTGILINFEKNVTYSLTTNKYYYLGMIPYEDYTQKISFQNYTIYNKTITKLNIIPMNIIVDYSYDVSKTQFTSVGVCSKVSSCKLVMNDSNSSLRFDTDKFIGLPSSDIIITGLTKYNVKIVYQDLYSQSAIDEKKNSLSSISGIIYAILNGAWKLLSFNLDAESEGVLNLLLILDEFFWLIGIVILSLFTYPYLLIVWILIMGNFFVSWKSTSIREIMFNYVEYFRFIGTNTYKLFTMIWNIIMKIIQAIRG